MSYLNVDHVCLVYDKDLADQSHALVLNIQEGLAGNEQCICITDDRTADGIRIALEAAGVDAARDSERGSLSFLSEKRGKRRALDNTFAEIRKIVESGLKAGFRGIRIIIETAAQLETDISPEGLKRWEAAIHEISAHHPVRVICLYNRNHFHPAAIKAALTSHPNAILNNRVCPNLFYEFPGTPDGESGNLKVDWMISQLKRTQNQFIRLEDQALERYHKLEQVYLMNDTVTHAKTIEEIYQAALNAISQSLKADRVSILLMDDAKVMRFKAWHGISDHYRQSVEGHSPWPADDVDPQPICIQNVDDTDMEENLRATVRGEGIRALGFFPLLHQKQLLGKFMVYYNSPHDFSGEEIRLIQTIGRHIAFSIERKMSEEKMLRTSRLESIGEIVGGLAHDFNNILAAIMGNLSVAKILVKPDTTVFKRMEKSQKAVLRAQSITQQLLAFSKEERPVRRVLSMAPLLRDLAGFALQGSNVLCECDISDRLSSVEADEGEIRQAVHNLILNAREAMPRGGVLRLQAGNISVGPDNALSLRSGDYIKILINDNGTGIPKENLPKIFDPLFTTKPNRTGMGLTRTQRIIQHYGGDISVESGPESGTVFSVYLPCTLETPAVRDSSEETVVQGKGRILFMDDEAEIREVTRELLMSIGYRVECCRDGMEAVQFLSRAQDLHQPFDAVILDLTVRGGMGGKEVVDKLRKIDPHVKIIISSGYSNDPVLLDYKEFGFSGKIAKPFTIENLSNSLNALFARSTHY